MDVGPILDEIDAVLEAGEPETGFDFGDPIYPTCPRGCGRHWHGMAVTRRIQQMSNRGYLDEDYRYSTDASEVLCPAPDFIGPYRPPWMSRPKPSDLQLSIAFTPEAIAQYQAVVREAVAAIRQTLQAFVETFAPVMREFAAQLGTWTVQRDTAAFLCDPPGWRPLGRLAGPAEFTPIVVEREGYPRLSGSLVLVAEQSKWTTTAELVAEAVREHGQAPHDAIEDNARAVLDARPIRLHGARAIPRALTSPPARHGPPSRGHGHRRNQ